MSSRPLDFPQLFERLRPSLDLKGEPAKDGWCWACCLDTAKHRKGDRRHSLRINAMTGGVRCMSQDCISGNLNDLAQRLGIDTHGDSERAVTMAKTYVALIVALSIATGEELLGLPVVPGRVLNVDYETDIETHRFRFNRLLPGFGIEWQLGLIDYWPAKGRPFPDIADAIGRKVERGHIGFILVDSAAYTCGGDPSNPEVTLRYFNALNALGKISLTIAHVPKDSDQERPYGSVYWANLARKTWNFRRIQDEGEEVINIGLFCKKVNDRKRGRPRSIRMTLEGEAGPVKVERRDELRPERNKECPLKVRIKDALKHGPRSYEELGDELEAKPDTIKARIHEMRDDLHRHSEGGILRWALRETRYE